VVVALDAQTVPGPFWMMQYDDELVEGLCVAAMSLARSMVASGIACGLGVNAYTSQGESRTVYIAPSSANVQIERIADQLADISRWASLPFSTLLHSLGRRMPPTTSIVALSGRDSQDYAPVMRRLSASGRSVRLYALGRYSDDSAAHARALGLHASVIKLEPSWRTADALKVVG